MAILDRLKRIPKTHEQVVLLGLGLAVGVLGGYGAVGFRQLIGFLRWLSYGPGGDILEVLAANPWWWRILIPALGGVLVGLLIYFFAPEAKGHGVPEVMEAVTLKSGIIRKRVVAVKSLASALSLAVGGSAGREGPIVQIGSAIGSTVGQVLKVSPNRMRILVGCGAAAGIAATFNAPVAGMIFALEIVLGEFAISTFSPIVLSAVMATAISRYYLGDFPAFIVPSYELVSFWEFFFYLVLGILSGAVAVAFTTSLYKMEDLWDAWEIPGWIKPAVTGAILGMIGMAFPLVLGVGYEGMELALAEKLAWWMLLLVLGIKILATSLTIGGGMSGGIFAPSLFMGCMLGGAFGYLVNWLLPGISAGPGAYSIVGMASVVAGTTHGPLSAFLILFEMTGGYKIILPLMIGCVVSAVVARFLRPESIYTLKLLRRGVDIEAGKEMNLLRSMRVATAMRSDVEAVPQNMPLGEFQELLINSKNASFPVIDGSGNLVGIVSHPDYQEHFRDENLWNLVVVKDLATPRVETVTPDDTLDVALSKISAKDFSTLPVIAGPDDLRLVGVLSHRDIISVYTKQLRKKQMEG